MRLLWGLVKFAIVAALLVAAGVWLADQPGRVAIDWRGWQVETSGAFLAFTVFLICLIVWKVGRLYGWLTQSGARRRERRLRRRQQDGLLALTGGLNALAAHDARAAQKAIVLAKKNLGSVPVATWLEAQLATLKQDHKGAAKAYLALTAEPSAANLGWRGLMATRLKGGEETRLKPLFAGALADKRIARQAYVHEARFAAAARRGDWEELRRALDEAAKFKALPRPRLRQVEQALLIARGQAIAPREPTQARLLLERAYRLAPDFPPAILAYLDVLIAIGDKTAAGKVIATAWALQPDGALLERFERVHENEPALSRLQRFERFAKKRLDEAETQLALASLSLSAELYGKAKTHIDRAQALRASPRAHQLLADLALAQNDAALAHLHARRGTGAALISTAYSCTICHTPHDRWATLCSGCGAFGSLAVVDSKATMQPVAAPLQF